MKKILAIAAVAALTAGVSAYAANPFSDVTPDDWAYQAVSDLSDQGVVEGYPDGTFKGERNMTRYELAQIIARLMAKEDQLNAEQRATLDKLAGEYADELANLGVRVSNLEKKVGNIYWSGDARMRYQDSEKASNDRYNGRIRINVKGQVNDSTYVQGRLLTEMNFKTNKADEANTSMDQLFVNHAFGDFQVRLGKQPLSFGNQGGWLLNPHDGYDGAQLSYAKDAFAAKVGFGKVNTSVFALKKADNEDPEDADVLFAQGAYDFDFAKLGVDYLATKEGKEVELLGANLAIPVAKKLTVLGDYYKNTVADGSDTAWNAGLAYGKANWKKPGTWDLGVYYNDVEKNVYFGGTGLQTSALSKTQDATFWNALANVTLQKNVQLHAEYAFDTELDDKDADDSWTVSLNYKF